MHCVRLSRISLVYPIQFSQALLLPVLLWLVFFSGLLHAQTAEATLRGVVTDPSGASVPGALVQVLQAGAERRATTNNSGQYQIGPLTPGTYRIRVLAKGFDVTQKENFEIKGSTVFDVQLTIQAETQVVNVEEEAARVSVDPASNGTAIVLGEKELEALSDDPDELSQELQAMAGPGAGPGWLALIGKQESNRAGPADCSFSFSLPAAGSAVFPAARRQGSKRIDTPSPGARLPPAIPARTP